MTRISMRLPGILALLAFALALNGCASKAPASPFEQTLTDAGVKSLCANLSQRGCEQKVAEIQAKKQKDLTEQAEKDRVGKLPHADPGVPDSQYVELNGGYQLATLFYALSGMPPDFEALASAASEEYRGAGDEFRKRDLLQALRPKMEELIATFRDPKNRYFIMEESGLPIQHYDFKTSSFPVNFNVGPTAYNFFNDAPKYHLSYNNGSDFLRFPVADEQRAKDIEAMVSKYELQSGQARLYVFVQEADTTNNQLKAQIVRVVLKDRKHAEIGRY